MTEAKPLYAKNITPFTLLFTKCSCGELHILGFWQQLEKKVYPKYKIVLVDWQCEKCGKLGQRRFQLTTSGKLCRPRWVNWSGLFWKVSKYLPQWAWRPAGWLTLWLECRVKL